MNYHILREGLGTSSLRPVSKLEVFVIIDPGHFVAISFRGNTAVHHVLDEIVDCWLFHQYWGPHEHVRFFLGSAQTDFRNPGSSPAGPFQPENRSWTRYHVA